MSLLVLIKRRSVKRNITASDNKNKKVSEGLID